MTKIYETPEDIQRYILLRKKQEAKKEAIESFGVATLYLLIGGLAQMVSEAKPHMTNVPKSNLWKAFGAERSLTTKLFKWGSFSAAIGSLILGFVFKKDQKNTERDLIELGEKQKILIREKDADPIVFDSLTDTGKLIKDNKKQHLSQAATTIQGSTIKSARLQDVAMQPLFQAIKKTI